MKIHTYNRHNGDNMEGIIRAAGGALGAITRQLKGKAHGKKLQPISVISNVMLGAAAGYILGVDVPTAYAWGLSGSYLGDNGIKTAVKYKGALPNIKKKK